MPAVGRQPDGRQAQASLGGLVWKAVDAFRKQLSRIQVNSLDASRLETGDYCVLISIIAFVARLALRVIVNIIIRLVLRAIVIAVLRLLDGAPVSAIHEFVRDLLKWVRDDEDGDAC